MGFEDSYKAAIKAGEAPGILLFASNAKGDFSYKTTLGKDSIDEDARPLEYDSVFWFASCTKLMTCIAVMQCVERGQLNLDEDLTETLLPELKDVEVLQGYDESGKPKFKKREGAITLRFDLSPGSRLHLVVG